MENSVRFRFGEAAKNSDPVIQGIAALGTDKETRAESHDSMTENKEEDFREEKMPQYIQVHQIREC